MAHLRNKLLAGLSDTDRALLEPLQASSLSKAQILDPANRPIENIYFPKSGIASVIALDEGGRRIEVGPFGREGMSGTPIILSIARYPLETSVQPDGTALRVSVEVLRRAVNDSSSLRQRLLGYVQAFHIQTTQTLLVNSYANLEQRLARWLLMAQTELMVQRYL